MTATNRLPIVEIPENGIIVPSGELWSDEPPLENEFHLRQLMLLIQCLELYWADRQDFYAFGNLTIYYSPRQRKSEFFRGPDFFVVLGTDRKSRKPTPSEQSSQERQRADRLRSLGIDPDDFE